MTLLEKLKGYQKYTSIGCFIIGFAFLIACLIVNSIDISYLYSGNMVEKLIIIGLTAFIYGFLVDGINLNNYC